VRAYAVGEICERWRLDQAYVNKLSLELSRFAPNFIGDADHLE
jgi:hypothetical protein